MEYKENLFESLIEKGEQYGKTTLELFKLKTIDKSADIASTLVSWIVVVVFIVLFFLIINIGIALWIGELLGKSYYGFFIVAGFYAFLSIVLSVLRKKFIKKPVNNLIISQVLD